MEAIIPNSPVVGGTRPLTRDLVIGRAMLESKLIHLLDAQAESEEFPEGSAIARRTGYRAIIAVPLMREGYAIGTIAVRRVEARLFSDKEVELLSNFAAEAVIAIENARLLTELRQRTADLSESLEQQSSHFRGREGYQFVAGQTGASFSGNPGERDTNLRSQNRDIVPL